MKNKLKYFVLLAALMLLFGCAGSSKMMRPVADPNISYEPVGNESVVIFMRPQTLGFAIQSSVFDVTTAENKLVGIVPAKKKVAYRTTPGKHQFMVVAESADFLQADLKAGKTYYVIVNPRIGVWKARFSLGAIRKEIEQAKLNDWLSTCEWVENTEDAYQWAVANEPSIHKKRQAYYIKWAEKADTDKPTLYPEDGF